MVTHTKILDTPALFFHFVYFKFVKKLKNNSLFHIKNYILSFKLAKMFFLFFREKRKKKFLHSIRSSNLSVKGLAFIDFVAKNTFLGETNSRRPKFYQKRGSTRPEINAPEFAQVTELLFYQHTCMCNVYGSSNLVHLALPISYQKN